MTPPDRSLATPAPTGLRIAARPDGATLTRPWRRWRVPLVVPVGVWSAFVALCILLELLRAGARGDLTLVPLLLLFAFPALVIAVNRTRVQVLRATVGSDGGPYRGEAHARPLALIVRHGPLPVLWPPTVDLPADRVAGITVVEHDRWRRRRVLYDVVAVDTSGAPHRVLIALADREAAQYAAEWLRAELELGDGAR